MECYTEQTTVAAGGGTTGFVVGARGGVFWVEDGFEFAGEDGEVEKVAEGFGGAVDAGDAFGKVTGVAFEEEGVGGPVGVFVSGVLGGLERWVEGRFGIKDKARIICQQSER